MLYSFMTQQDPNDGITLKDVIIHMQHMEQRLSGETRQLSLKVDENTQHIKQLYVLIKTQEVRLLEYIDGLGEDLTATMKDVFRIQQYVGLRSADDE
jgi:hypothetical protein